MLLQFDSTAVQSVNGSQFLCAPIHNDSAELCLTEHSQTDYETIVRSRARPARCDAY